MRTIDAVLILAIVILGLLFAGITGREICILDDLICIPALQAPDSKNENAPQLTCCGALVRQ